MIGEDAQWLAIFIAASHARQRPVDPFGEEGDASRASASYREMPMRKLLTLMIFALMLTSAIVLSGVTARSQGGRTIRIVISVPPGGSIDILARILADHVS